MTGEKDEEVYVKISSEKEVLGTFNNPEFKMLRGATSFFRNDNLFKPLIETIIPSFRGKNVNVWSAGCSSGKEAYSVAMAFLIDDPGSRKDVKIYATDINKEVISEAKAGSYLFSAKDEASFGTFWEGFAKRDGKNIVFNPEIKNMIRFSITNIFDSDQLPGMDIIICNHVLQYYDDDMQFKVISKLAEKLDPGGFIYIDIMSPRLKKMPLKKAFEKGIFWYVKC